VIESYSDLISMMLLPKRVFDRLMMVLGVREMPPLGFTSGGGEWGVDIDDMLARLPARGDERQAVKE
jgi:hypothetical protein